MGNFSYLTLLYIIRNMDLFPRAIAINNQVHHALNFDQLKTIGVMAVI